MELRSVSSAAVLRITALVFGVIIALRFLWIAHAIFIVTFLGVLLGLAVARAADFLERFRIPRGLGAALVVLTTVGLVVLLGVLFAPSVQGQSGEVAEQLPKLLAKLRPPGAIGAQITKELRASPKFLFPLVTSVFGALGGAVLVIFIAMYIGAQPGLYRAGLVHLVPHAQRERADEVFKTLAVTLRQWLVARLLAMVAIGAVTGIALALLKVKGAAALGLLAGLLEFVPFFGPVVSAVPAIGVALLDSPQKALYVVILYLVVQQLEGHVITPLILQKRLDIPPVMTVVGVASLGIAFGVLGMLIAEPLLAVVLVTTKMLYVNDVVGDDVKVGNGES